MGITSTSATSSLSSENATKRIAIVNTWTYNDLTSGETAGTVKIRYQYSNHLGSASLELNDAGEFVSYQEYFPFGETAYTLGEVSTEYRFTGKERDEFTGLYYFGARYYAPWMFRWMNPDPSGPVDGLNVFVYCTNRPIVMVDPDGRKEDYALQDSLMRAWKKEQARIDDSLFKVQAQKNIDRFHANESAAQAYEDHKLFLESEHPSNWAYNVDENGNGLYEQKNINKAYTVLRDWSKDYRKKTWDSFVKGEFSDETTELAIAMNISLAFLGLDAPMDVIDPALNSYDA